METVGQIAVICAAVRLVQQQESKQIKGEKNYIFHT